MQPAQPLAGSFDFLTCFSTLLEDSRWTSRLRAFGRLAAALNRGVEAAAARGCEWVLLFDQDTEADEDLVAELAAAVVEEAKTRLGDEPMEPGEERALLTAMAEQVIGRQLRVRGQLPQPGDTTRVVALVGPSGAGNGVPMLRDDAKGGGGATSGGVSAGAVGTSTWSRADAVADSSSTFDGSAASRIMSAVLRTSRCRWLT